jgi:hypothetical protein
MAETQELARAAAAEAAMAETQELAMAAAVAAAAAAAVVATRAAAANRVAGLDVPGALAGVAGVSPTAWSLTSWTSLTVPASGAGSTANTLTQRTSAPPCRPSRMR